jgi:hypothetical protein
LKFFWGEERDKLTLIDISDNNSRALIRKQPRCFRSDALTGAGDDGRLAREHSLREVQMSTDLRETVGCHILFYFFFRFTSNQWFRQGEKKKKKAMF